ncbi:MAG: hypothetical protein IJE72_01520 [Clostridia bacterium]|nr:hypothetical protein [Clostridia bacterium]
MKKITAIIMTMVLLFSAMSISVYAESSDMHITVTVNGVDFIFDASTSEEFRSKFIENYFNPDDDGAAAYGLTCTLFGHKLESAVITTITHKVRTSAPRCLRETYDTEACTRCDYTSSTLISSEYISCC